MTTVSASHDELSQPFQLPAGSVEKFEQEGFIHLYGVLSPELIRDFEPEVTEKVIELNTMDLPLSERDTYHKAFLQVENLWEHSAVVKELAFSTRLAKIAADLMGVRGVRMFHDQALYKEAGGGITPWHADQYYWPINSDRSCTIWLPLQDTPLEMGPLSFARGSHKMPLGRDLPIGDESERTLQQLLAEQEFPIVERPYRLGDASYHLGWTFHRASPNTREDPRRVMTVIYIDADLELVGTADATQQQTIDRWFPGCRPGDVPESPLSPVLWARDS